AGAEGLAAATACAVLCVEDMQPEDGVVGHRADVAVQPAFAVAAASTRRAGVGLGLAADRDDLLARFGFHAHGLRSWVTGFRYRCPRTQALSVNPSTTYGVFDANSGVA